MTEFIKGYHHNTVLRRSFDALSIDTFGLSLEDWYQNRFWGDNYVLYSIVEDDKVVANISVSITNMSFRGETKKFIQLGNVMTDRDYRNRGYIRQIMNQIDADYGDKTDGIYLFANDTVLDFYPKFGFKRAKEYQYSKQVLNCGECQYEKVIMDNTSAWENMVSVMDRNRFHGRFDMIGNHELIMFYVTKFMGENVYYHKKSNTFVIAEAGAEQVLIHNVFSTALVDVDDVITWFGKNVKKAVLGFVPMSSAGYKVEELRKENTTLFIKGNALNMIEREKLRIPSLSHA